MLRYCDRGRPPEACSRKQSLPRRALKLPRGTPTPRKSPWNWWVTYNYVYEECVLHPFYRAQYEMNSSAMSNRWAIGDHAPQSVDAELLWRTGA